MKKELIIEIIYVVALFGILIISMSEIVGGQKIFLAPFIICGVLLSKKCYRIYD